MANKLECFYTSYGMQRYTRTVGAICSYELKDAPAGSVVYFTEMEVPHFEIASKSEWDAFLNSFTPLLDKSGVINNATAVRVFVGGENAGLVKLEMHALTDPVMGCAGELAKMNARLAATNRNMAAIKAMAA